MSNLDSINAEQRLYVLKCGKGYSCLGFDVAEKQIRAVVAWLRSCGRGIIVTPVDIGTPAHYTQYESVIEAGREHSAKTGARCPADLTPQLAGLEGKRVEVTTPSGETSRFYVGKSTGWMPCHLEVKTRRSLGGGAAYIPAGSKVRVVGAR